MKLSNLWLEKIERTLPFDVNDDEIVKIPKYADFSKHRDNFVNGLTFIVAIHPELTPELEKILNALFKTISTAIGESKVQIGLNAAVNKVESSYLAMQRLLPRDSKVSRNLKKIHDYVVAKFYRPYGLSMDA